MRMYTFVICVETCVPVALLCSRTALSLSLRLAKRCSLSSAVSSALRCRSRSLLLRSLSSRPAAQALGVLSMIVAESKELSAKEALCRSRLENCHGYDGLYCSNPIYIYIYIILYVAPSAPAMPKGKRALDCVELRRPLCLRKTT